MRGLKIIGRVALTLVAALFVLCAIGEIHQRIVVRRANQLLADIHGLRLHQSTWTDAQRFMSRWGKWGHHDGTCTSVECTYIVSIDSWSTVGNVAEFPSRTLALIEAQRLLPHQWGGGLRQLQSVFLVQDGVIRRSGVAIDMTVSPFAIDSQHSCCGDELIISTLARPSLGGIWADEENFTRHPDYKVWRPSGCTFCLMGRVTYADSVTPAEATRLSAFDLSCATRWSSCTTLEQLDPAARDWRLYGPPWGEASNRDTPPPDPAPTCNIPVSARARDGDFVVIVEALSDSQPKIQVAAESDVVSETSQVRVLSQQKGPSLVPAGSIVTANSHGRRDEGTGLGKPRHLLKGHRYVVFVSNDDDLPATAGSHFGFQPCGIDELTPTVENDLRRGIALDDRLRGPELGVSLEGFHRGVAKWDY